METPRKKHLIELMIEAGVKWPEGAEYAAQDNRDLYVWFYSEKPKLACVNKGKWTSDVNYENGRKCCIVDGEKLNEICLDWHQTIVTREQYAEALVLAANVGEPAVQYEQKVTCPDIADHRCFSCDTPVDAVEWHNPPSIEQLTADDHAKAAEADRLQSVADEALKAADDALLALEKAGELLGLVISIDTKPKHVEPPVEPVQPVITDWRDLRVGDVVEYVRGTIRRHDGKQGYVCEIDESDNRNRVRVMFGEDDRSWCSKWRFIRRP